MHESAHAPVRAHQLATRRQHWQSERARSQVHYTWDKEQEGNLRRDKRSRLGSTTRQTCTHAALTQSRMQHLRCKTGSERAPPGILLCCACLSAGPTVLAGQQAPSEPSWAQGNRGPSRWNRCHADLSAGQAWYNRRAIRPKRRSLPPEAHALGRLNRRGCVGYNERGARLQRERPRLQRAPLSLNSTGLLLVAAVRSLLATSPRVITPLPSRIRGGYDGSIGILRT
jgi:hypothetical protein